MLFEPELLRECDTRAGGGVETSASFSSLRFGATSGIELLSPTAIMLPLCRQFIPFVLSAPMTLILSLCVLREGKPPTSETVEDIMLLFDIDDSL